MIIIAPVEIFNVKSINPINDNAEAIISDNLYELFFLTSVKGLCLFGTGENIIIGIKFISAADSQTNRGSS